MTALRPGDMGPNGPREIAKIFILIYGAALVTLCILAAITFIQNIAH